MKYPIDEQDFREIREKGYVYIDKTQYIPLLLENKFYFLSRPRRFGKSLFLSTLEHFFLGHKELFEALSISEYPWEWQEYPVIRIDLTVGDFTVEENLYFRFSIIFDEIEEKFQLPLTSSLPLAERLRKIIRNLSEKTGKQVVILVDEYEKPLLSVMDDTEKLTRYRNTLSGIYSVLKSESGNIKLAFLTGVTRFGHLNIFSGLNNLKDISLSPAYSAICGITEEEMLSQLRAGIKQIAEKSGKKEGDVIEELKSYYDGYHFSKALVDIYNPFSLLDSLKEGHLSTRWFQSGSSSFLIRTLNDNNYNLTNLEGLRVHEDTLTGLEPAMKDAVTLLYQSGYLTIKDYDSDTDTYILSLPNKEVKDALYKAIIPYYLGTNHKVDTDKVARLSTLLKEGKADEAMQWLKSFFGSIPYDMHLRYERDFQTVVYSLFALVGMMAEAELEKHTSGGRIDLVLSLQDYVYVFEFKLGKDARAAIEQIHDRDYPLQWRSDNREVYTIGVAFSPESRGISDYIILNKGARDELRGTRFSKGRGTS